MLLVGFGGGAVLAATVRQDTLSADRSVRELLRSTDSGIFSLLYLLANNVASIVVWNGAIGGVAIALLTVRRRLDPFLLVIPFATEVLAVGTKYLIDRPRPDLGAVVGLEAASFPSGHVFRVVVTTFALLAFWQHSAWPWRPAMVGAGVLGIVVVATARVATGAHWPTDVLGAVLLGSGWGYTLAAFAGYAQRQDAKRRLE